jgi:hypothetical protein
MRLMETLNINMYALNKGNLINIEEKYKITAYECCDDIIKSKNAIPEKKGNCSIRLDRLDNDIYISLKLDKGTGKSFRSYITRSKCWVSFSNYKCV